MTTVVWKTSQPFVKMLTRYSFLAATLAVSLRADVSLAPLFTDGAVLQRDKPVAIWGSAEPGERVSVTFRDQAQGATTGTDGRWVVFLEAQPANIQGADLIVTGKNVVTVRDVVVGEVWLCSGESNMELMLKQAANGAAEIAAANFPFIRHVKIMRQTADAPVGTVPTSGWAAASPETAGDFTAVGYFFAREIFRKLNVPIGLVNATWGGTPIEAWMSPAAFAATEYFSTVNARWAERVESYPTERVNYASALTAWTLRETAAREASPAAYKTFLKDHPKPRLPRGAAGDPAAPTRLFNGMINPLLPYGLRGVLWYQGESNATEATEYHAQFSELITEWRAHFGQDELPFYWVNLAGYRVPGDATNTAFAFLREAQTRTLVLPHTGQALAIDLGQPDEIQPTNKHDVGSRLAALARTRVYSTVGDDTGPTFLSAVREGSAMRVRFAHASGGLVPYERPVQSLELAGPNQVFYPAAGRIERDTLVVTAPEVNEPMAVRYAWKNFPAANLYNGAGLPAVPFRSDNW